LNFQINLCGYAWGVAVGWVQMDWNALSVRMFDVLAYGLPNNLIPQVQTILIILL